MILKHRHDLFFKLSLILLTALIFCYGCATVQKLNNDSVLALVNNDPITYGDLKDGLQALHLQNKGEEKTGSIDIQGFLDKLINRRLFIQETRGSGLENREDVAGAVRNELKRQGILLLYKEEIEDKVEVTDEEAWQEYKRRGEENVAELKTVLNDIAVSTDPNSYKEETKRYLMMFRKRAIVEIDPNFSQYTSRDPNETAARVDNNKITYEDVAGNIKTNDTGHCTRSCALKLLIDHALAEKELKSVTPTAEGFDRIKNGLKNGIRKRKIKEREVSYLEELLQKADIHIDKGPMYTGKGDPNATVALVNNEKILLGTVLKGLDLKHAADQDRIALKEDRLQYLINCLVVDQEALSRGYEKRKAVKETLGQVKENMLFQIYLNEVLAPSIKIEEEAIKKYYDTNPHLFKTPVLIKAEEIKVSTQEEAKQIIIELEKGADFSFLTNRSFKNRLKADKWVNLDKMPAVVRQAVENAKEGDIVGPFSLDGLYSVLALKRRQEAKPIAFDASKEKAFNMLWQERFEEAIKKWESTLRDSAQLVIYNDRIKALEKNL